MSAPSGVLFPSVYTNCFNQRKLSHETTAPSAKPAPPAGPLRTKAIAAPAAANRIIALEIRATGRSRNCSSSVIAGIPQQRADELHETPHDSQDLKGNVQPGR